MDKSLIKSFALLVVLSVFLLGCTNKNLGSLQLIIPSEYTYFFAQTVNEDSIVTDSKMIEDNKKVEELISMLNGVEIIPFSDEAEMQSKNKQLNEQGNYIFALSDSEDLEDDSYYMTMFKDGSMFFSDQERNMIAYTAKEKNPELLEKIIHLFDL